MVQNSFKERDLHAPDDAESQLKTITPEKGTPEVAEVENYVKCAKCFKNRSPLNCLSKAYYFYALSTGSL